MGNFTELSVTTSDGTKNVLLGNGNSITIDSPLGPAGTPAATARRQHTFGGFLQWGSSPHETHGVYLSSAAMSQSSYGAIYPDWNRISGLAYAAGVVTVTKAGTPVPDHPAYPADPWTETIDVPVDDSSVLVVAGAGPAADQTIPLAGLSAISLTEAAA